MRGPRRCCSAISRKPRNSRQNERPEALRLGHRQPHPHDPGALPERGEHLVRVEPHEVLFGGHQREAAAIGLRDQAPGFATRIGVVIGEASSHRRFDPGRGQRGKEFLRVADPGKRQHPSAGNGGEVGPVGREPALENRKPPPPGRIPDGGDRPALLPLPLLPNDQDGMRPRKLRLERRAQGPGGKDATVADAARAVHHQNGQVLGERWVLKAVVHDHDAGAACTREIRAQDAVARHDRRRKACQQQRLVADLAAVCRAGSTRTGPASEPP